jgi:hypothetical protein
MIPTAVQLLSKRKEEEFFFLQCAQGNCLNCLVSDHRQGCWLLQTDQMLEVLGTRPCCGVVHKHSGILKDHLDKCHVIYWMDREGEYAW